MFDHRPPSFRPREWAVLHATAWATFFVPESGGRYLCTPTQISSANRLIDRHLIRRIETAIRPPDPTQMVVTLTPFGRCFATAQMAVDDCQRYERRYL